MKNSLSCCEQWLSLIGEMDKPRILETGTKGWDGKPPVHRKELILRSNPEATWFGTDMEAGKDVDIVADLHSISDCVPRCTFDGIFCASVLEHVRQPWIVAEELGKITRLDGLLFLSTHYVFPFHGYPTDYFRFSREAIAELFCLKAGWQIIDSEYTCPCKIMPLTNAVHDISWNFEAEAWLNVDCLARRIPCD